MDLLVLGGTRFVGRHLVRAALERGHRVTLFNRGQSAPDLFTEAENLSGDREGDLSALRGRKWDAVVDTCGYVPRVVRASAELLADAVDRYVFVSSISVYRDPLMPGADESAPVAVLEDEPVEEVTAETYGALKALCERAAEEAMPGRTISIRPGLIAGPHDPTGRFAYWPRRAARGGDALAPGDPERPVQFVDARDLARWLLVMAELGESGTYNAAGPEHTLTMGGLLEECANAAGSDVRFTWMDDDFLEERGVESFTELPLWLPEEHAGMLAVDNSGAVAAGLEFRPVGETIRDVLEYERGHADAEYDAGLDPERERELLGRWHEGRNTAR
ncbi:MAG: SDR family oxidoreductase [Rubrobacteraceae bacterium]